MRINEYYNRFRMFDVPAVLTGNGSKLLVNLEKWYTTNGELIKKPCSTNLESLNTMVNTIRAISGYLQRPADLNREALSKELCYIYADKELECFASNTRASFFLSFLKEGWVLPFISTQAVEDSSHLVWLKSQTPQRVMIRRESSMPDTTEDGILRIGPKDSIRLINHSLRTETALTFSLEMRSSECVSNAYLVGNYLLIVQARRNLMATYPTFFLIDLNMGRVTKAYPFTEVCIYKNRIDVWYELPRDNISLFRFPVMQMGAKSSPDWIRYSTFDFFRPNDVDLVNTHSSTVERLSRQVIGGSRGSNVLVYHRNTSSAATNSEINNLVVDLRQVRHVRQSYERLNKSWAYDDTGLLARVQMNMEKGYDIEWDIIKKPEFKYVSITKPVGGNTI